MQHLTKSSLLFECIININILAIRDVYTHSPLCRFAVCTEPGRASLRPSASDRRCFYHWWVYRRQRLSYVEMNRNNNCLHSVCRLLHNFADKRRKPVRDQQLSVTGTKDFWPPGISDFISAAVPLPIYW